MGYFFECFANYLFLLPVFLLLEAGLFWYYRRRNVRMGIGSLLTFQCLMCYLCSVFSITGAGGLDDLGQFHSNLLMELNVIPFTDGITFDLVMNVFLFLPLGILLPFLWSKGASPLETIQTGFLLSLLIECSQLCNFRATDLEDLLMNTLGTMVGYLLYALLFRRFRAFQIPCHRSQKNMGLLLSHGPIVITLIVFLIHFFIGSPLSATVWNALYRPL